jgi:hypothetical protein
VTSQLVIAEKKIEKSCQELEEAHLPVLNTKSGQRTDFRIIFWNSGHLRGVPVQIECQPNWWFRVTSVVMGKPAHGRRCVEYEPMLWPRNRSDSAWFAI